VSERQPGPTSPAFGDRSANLARLDPESVAAIARYVVALLRDGDEPGGLIDAAEVARRRGVSRDWVYRHADELGAVRMGEGSRPRLRFPPVTPRLPSEGSVAAQAPATPAKSRGRPRRENGHNGALLPIGPKRGGPHAAR